MDYAHLRKQYFLSDSIPDTEVKQAVFLSKLKVNPEYLPTTKEELQLHPEYIDEHIPVIKYTAYAYLVGNVFFALLFLYYYSYYNSSGQGELLALLICMPSLLVFLILKGKRTHSTLIAKTLVLNLLPYLIGFISVNLLEDRSMIISAGIASAYVGLCFNIITVLAALLIYLAYKRKYILNYKLHNKSNT